MKVYPFARENAVVEQIALRVAGSDTPWNPRDDRLDLAPPENGEPIQIEVRIDLDVPTVLDRPLIPAGHPLTIVAVALSRYTLVGGRPEMGGPPEPKEEVLPGPDGALN